jgi:hypothetical protein
MDGKLYIPRYTNEMLGVNRVLRLHSINTYSVNTMSNNVQSILFIFGQLKVVSNRKSTPYQIRI